MEKMLLKVFKDMKIEVTAIDPQAKFDADLGMDSQELTEFHVHIEKELNAVLPSDWFQREMTVGEFMKKCESLKGGTAWQA